MDPEYVKKLIDLVSASGIETLEFRQGDTVLTIRSGPGTPGGEAVAEMSGSPTSRAARLSTGDVVTAVTDGIVHLAPGPGEAHFVSEGQIVECGDALCLIEVMKTFHAVSVTQAGTVGAIHVKDGQEVAFGDLLFEIV